MNYRKAFDELRALNIESMGSGPWLQHYINSCKELGRTRVVIPPGVYDLSDTLYIPASITMIEGQFKVRINTTSFWPFTSRIWDSAMAGIETVKRVGGFKKWNP